MALVLSLSSAAIAQTGSAHFQAKFELTFDCERPLLVRNHPIHAVFTAVLNTDKSASADLALTGLIFTNRVHFDARLGATSQPAPGGTSQLRVISSNRLRGVWDLPNNQLVLDIIAVKSSCSTALNIKLKPGKTEYSMFDGHTFFYCSAYHLLGSDCQAQ
jgi:hypothetical protein